MIFKIKRALSSKHCKRHYMQAECAGVCWCR